RGAGDEDRGAAVIAAIQHRIESRNAGRDALAAHLVAQAERGDREDRDALLGDEERVFVRAVPAATVFHHPQPPGRDLLLNAMIEQQHAIGDVLLETLARESAFAALGRNDRRDTPIFQPTKEPAELG